MHLVRRRPSLERGAKCHHGTKSDRTWTVSYVLRQLFQDRTRRLELFTYLPNVWVHRHLHIVSRPQVRWSPVIPLEIHYISKPLRKVQAPGFPDYTERFRVFLIVKMPFQQIVFCVTCGENVVVNKLFKMNSDAFLNLLSFYVLFL